MKRCKYISLSIIGLLLNACQPSSPALKIAINPWPGYEVIAFALHKNFFKQVGLDNVELIDVGSLNDAVTIYSRSDVNVLCSTMAEVITSKRNYNIDSKIIYFADYSNGGDFVLANDQIKGISNLKGKIIAYEAGTIGVYILERMLDKAHLKLNDVTLIEADSASHIDLAKNKSIDAAITYPPFGIQLKNLFLKNEIFNSKELPREILDTISMKNSIINQYPNTKESFLKAIDRTIAYIDKNKDEFFEFGAKREKITKEEFIGAIAGVKQLSIHESNKILKTNEGLIVLQRIDELVRRTASNKEIINLENIINDK